MVHVAHDRNHRRPRHEVLGPLILADALPHRTAGRGFFGLLHDRGRFLNGLEAELARNDGRSLIVNLLVDIGQNTIGHEFFDYVDRTDLQLVRQFSDASDWRATRSRPDEQVSAAPGPAWLQLQQRTDRRRVSPADRRGWAVSGSVWLSACRVSRAPGDA